MPDIDLDFPRDIREKLIVAVTERYGREHAALVASFATYRSRGAIRDVGKALGLPYAELERLARLTDGWNAKRVAEEVAALPDARAEARLAPLARVPDADRRDRRPAAARLPAPGRDGDLVAAARRARARAAGRDGRAAALPVGQGLVRRCGLPQDRPARARDALVRRGLRRPDRAAARRADRPLAHPPRRPRGVRRDPAGGHGRHVPDREPRADAEPAAHEAGDDRRPHRAGRARAARARSRGRRCTRTSSARQRLREDPAYVRPVDHELLREPLRATHGVVVFQDQVLDVAIALAGFTRGGGGGAAAGDEPQALATTRSRRTASASSRARRARASTRRPRTASTTSSSASPASASRSRTRPRSGCSPTSRRGCATTTRPSSCARSSTSSRWASTRPRASSATRSGTGWRCCPPDVNLSGARAALVESRARRARIGLGYVASVGEDDAEALVAERDANGPFRGHRATGAPRAALPRRRSRRSSRAAPATPSGTRRDLLWQLGLVFRAAVRAGQRGRGEAAHARARADRGDAGASATSRAGSACSPTTARRACRSASTRSSSSARICRRGRCRAAELHDAPHGSEVAYAGLAIARQRPSTAKGIVFMLLEDELGQVNLIVPSQVYERHRAIVRGEPLLLARGRFERVGREPQHPRLDARDARPARPPRGADEHDVWASLPRPHSFGHR